MGVKFLNNSSGIKKASAGISQPLSTNATQIT